jgi:hypothetical protein
LRRERVVRDGDEVHAGRTGTAPASDAGPHTDAHARSDREADAGSHADACPDTHAGSYSQTDVNAGASRAE